MVTTFDGPTGEACLAKRNRSNTPLQALTLLNDPMFIDLAQATGRRLAARKDASVELRIEELFSSLVVHKTASASLDEGSLGAVVDLNTGNPLGGKSGLRGAVSVIGSYNDLSKDFGPRLAGLLSWRNDAGTFGISASAAYSKTNVLELGNNTVRWAQARFDGVGTTNCFTTQNSGGTYVASAACDQAALAFHPRIPRYGEVAHDRERLGLTGSVQFAPTDSTKLSIDALYSKFSEDRAESWGEVLLRSNERSINVVNPVYDSNNNMISATLNDAWVRTESYLRKSSTEFYQVGGTWDQDLGDRFRFTLTGGQQGDAPQAEALIADLPAGVVMADTAYDSDRLREIIARKKALAVIPNNPSRARKHPLDKHLYAQRHLIECCFSKLKQFRRVATRYEKTARNYLAVVTIAAIVLWIR
jgi:TonB-dependent receptor